MDGNPIFRRHTQEHAPEPIVRERGQEIGNNGKLGTTEGRRDGVTSERDRVIRCNVLLVADAVAELVGIECGVVSGVINLESSGVEAPDRRPRHDEHYHEA
jgi:hypothetical protein